MENKSGATKAPKLENAIADMKRQLRSESKSTLIKQWVSLYAQTVVQQKLIADLNAQIENLKMPEVVSEQEVNLDIEADASKGVSE